MKSQYKSKPCKYGSSCRYGPDKCRFLHTPEKPTDLGMEDIHLRYIKYKEAGDIKSYYEDSKFTGWEDLRCDISRSRFSKFFLPPLTIHQMEFLIYKRFGFSLKPPYGIRYIQGGYDPTPIIPFGQTTWEGCFSGYDYKRPIPKEDYRAKLLFTLTSCSCKFCGAFDHHSTKCDSKAAEICHACDTRGHSTESCTRVFTAMEVKKRLDEHKIYGYKSDSAF